MPIASNFTIKDGASTPADTVFTNVTRSGGSLPATYYARSKGTAQAHQPVLRVSSRGVQKGRETKTTIAVPFSVLGADGVTRVVDTAHATLVVTLPDAVPSAARSDLRAYLANSLDITQFVETNTEGFAPN